MDATKPTLQPLGDAAVLIRFGERLDEEANSRAIATARWLTGRRLPGVTEIVPSLVSVLVRYDPEATGLDVLTGELRLALSVDRGETDAILGPHHHDVPVKFGGEGGPDLEAAAAALEIDTAALIAAHNATRLRVMAVGFAPGFVYCGMHPPELHLPRRREVRPLVPAGSVLFAAGQTAIAATPIPTGWYVIGQTPLRNFQPSEPEPVVLQPGDTISFRVAR